MQTADAHSDAHEQCAALQFQALRAEFGYNLGRLSATERGKVDSTCSRLRRPENVDPYLNCVTALLVAVREQRRGADGIAPGTSALSFGVPSLPARPSAPAPAPRHVSLIVASVFGFAVVIAAGAAGVVRVKKASRHTPRVCQKCGEALNAAGDLCASCRHDAGIAAKQAIAERAAEERAEQERLRRERESAEERQQQLERQAAEQAAELERFEQARRHAEQNRRDSEPVAVSVPSKPIGADVEDPPASELDPYAVLGVSREASRQEIDNAYCAAASKYDETQVAHLGDAVQAHYRAKAEAVEQAYRTLTGTAA